MWKFYLRPVQVGLVAYLEAEEVVAEDGLTKFRDTQPQIGGIVEGDTCQYPMRIGKTFNVKISRNSNLDTTSLGAVRKHWTSCI